MRKFSIAITALLICLLINCQKKQEDTANMEDPRTGVFVSEKASLTLSNIIDRGMGESMDFQIDFITEKQSGTFFGTAEAAIEGGFSYRYESLGIIHNFNFNYEDNKWDVKYSADNPENKELFDYTGLYIKKEK